MSGIGPRRSTAPNKLEVRVDSGGSRTRGLPVHRRQHQQREWSRAYPAELGGVAGSRRPSPAPLPEAPVAPRKRLHGECFRREREMARRAAGRHGQRRGSDCVSAARGLRRADNAATLPGAQFFGNQMHLRWNGYSRWIVAPMGARAARSIHRIAVDTGSARQLTGREPRLGAAIFAGRKSPASAATPECGGVSHSLSGMAVDGDGVVGCTQGHI